LEAIAEIQSIRPGVEICLLVNRDVEQGEIGAARRGENPDRYGAFERPSSGYLRPQVARVPAPMRHCRLWHQIRDVWVTNLLLTRRQRFLCMRGQKLDSCFEKSGY
jgi:hypothetical protein